MKNTALIVFAFFVFVSAYSQEEYKGCSVFGNQMRIEDSLQAPIVKYTFLSCKDSTAIKGAKAYFVFESGKKSKRRLDKNGDIYFSQSEFLSIKMLEIRSDGYIGMIWSEEGIEGQKRNLRKGYSMNYFFYSDIIEYHTLY